jgi:uncharacterized sulfatase
MGGTGPDQPFFAVINLTTAHEGQIRLDDAQFAKATAALEPGAGHDPAGASIPPCYPDTPIVRKDWARYYDLIAALDGQVNAILRQFDGDGLADRTVVFFWGDRGRGLPRAKRFTSESGLRVPRLVPWPGAIAPGSVVDDLVSLMDLGPTVLAPAGLPIPEQMQGRPILGPARVPVREFAFGHCDRMDEAYDMMRTIRDRRFRYIKNSFPGRPYAQHIDHTEEMPTMRE